MCKKHIYMHKLVLESVLTQPWSGQEDPREPLL